MTYSESPVSKIFGGKLQSSVTGQHKKESVTVQPFFSLQLDVQVSVNRGDGGGGGGEGGGLLFEKKGKLRM